MRDFPNDDHRATRMVRIVAFAMLSVLFVLANAQLFRLRLPYTVSPIELMWMEFSIIGLSFQTRGLVDSVLDLRSLRMDRRNGARKIVALNALRGQACACVMHCLFLMIGAVAITQPPADSRRAPSVIGLVLTVALFGANTALVVNAVLQRRARAKLERYLDEAENDKRKLLDYIAEEGIGV